MDEPDSVFCSFLEASQRGSSTISFHFSFCCVSVCPISMCVWLVFLSRSSYMLDLHGKDGRTVLIERWMGPIRCSIISSRPLSEDPQLFHFISRFTVCLRIRLQYDSDSFFWIACMKVLTPHSKESSNSSTLARFRLVLGGRPYWEGSSVNYRLVIHWFISLGRISYTQYSLSYVWSTSPNDEPKQQSRNS